MKEVGRWPLTTRRETPIKIGAKVARYGRYVKVARYGRYVTFQRAKPRAQRAKPRGSVPDHG